MTTIINGSSPSITFSDSTTQSSGVNTTNPVFTGDASISGLTVGKGGGAAATNTAVGASALASLPSSSYIYNTAIGYQALTASNGASQNTACGYTAMAATTSGGANASFGDLSLKSNTTGGYNSALGSEALTANTTGSNNVAVGQKALQANTTASNNTAVGYNAFYSGTTGASVVAIGVSSANALVTGSNGIYIGAASTSSSTSVNSEIVIATNGPTGKGANTGFISPNNGGVYQGNNSSTWSTTSDQRLKKNIVDNTDGLNKITGIRVRNFEYRIAEEITELPAHAVIDKQGVQLGVIAQELQAVLPDCVKTESTGVMSVDTDNLIWYLVNSIKELKAEIDLLKGA